MEQESKRLVFVIPWRRRIFKGRNLVFGSERTSVSKDNLIALILFFSKYKQYQGNDFYLAGQDYAGIYVPMLARLILDYNDQMQEIHFNLMGFLLGNACTMR